MRKIFSSNFPITRTFVILIALLAVSSYAIFALLDHARDIFFSHADSQNQSVIDLAANMVDERINAKLIQLQALAYTAASQTDYYRKPSLNKRLEQLKYETEKIGYNFIQLTDPDGNSVSSNGNIIKIADTEHFYKPIRGFLIISQILNDATKKETEEKNRDTLLLSVPIFSGADVIGVLTAKIETKKLSFLENIHIPYSNASLYLMDKNSNIVEQSEIFLKDPSLSMRSFNFSSPITVIATSDDLMRIKEEIAFLNENPEKPLSSDKSDRLISFAALPHSNEWKLVAVSSKNSIRSQQNSLLIIIGGLFLLITFFISVTAIYLYVIRWKYRRISDLSHNTMDKTGFYFFKLSYSGEVRNFDDDFAFLLGISQNKSTFNFRDFAFEGGDVFPLDIADINNSFKISVHSDLNENIYLLIQVIGKNENGFYPAFAIDVTKDEIMQEKIRNLAYIDSTTDIPNRESFVLKIEDLNEKCLRESFKSGLLFIDINDSHKTLEIFGHRLFQEMLREIAKRLSSIADETKGSIYNLGSDDFVLVIDNYEQVREMLAIADAIKREIAKPFQLGDASFELSCRIGIVSCPEYLNMTQITPSDMLRYGEITVRLAKTNENLFILDMKTYLSVLKEFDMEMDLFNSIVEDELVLLYQPIYSSENEKITAVEALLSWKSKKHGQVTPSVFIPLAEKNGFINKLGDFVIDTAIDFASKLDSQQQNIAVNFNVSLIQFLEIDFVDKLINKFKYRNLPEQSMRIEITESCFCNDITDLGEKLTMIRNAGITISVDDFGTGYCCLSYLKDLPVDYLKIDRSFITDIEKSDKLIKILKGIVNIAKSMGVDVIAEGVETVDQLNAVLSCGCSNIQGFLIARPMNEKDTLDFINSFKGLKK